MTTATVLEHAMPKQKSKFPTFWLEYLRRNEMAYQDFLEFCRLRAESYGLQQDEVLASNYNSALQFQGMKAAMRSLRVFARAPEKEEKAYGILHEGQKGSGEAE